MEPRKAAEAGQVSSVEAWHTEAHLVAFARKTLPALLVGRGEVLVVDELAIGRGSPDLLIWQVDPTAWRRRMRRAARGCSAAELRVLNAMHLRQPLRASTVAQRVGLRENDAEDVLSRLVSSGFAEEVGKCYVRTHGASRSVTRILSVEAKLSNWRAALRQAYRNTLFANESYVILDRKHANGALDNSDLFRRAQVGLCIADALSGSVEVVLRPRRRQPRSQYFRMLATETLIAHARKSVEMEGG